MCGRFALTITLEKLLEVCRLPGNPLPTLPASLIPLLPRFNLAPTQLSPVLRYLPGQSRSDLTFLRWGLIPAWAKDPAIGVKMINARAETLAEKPSFKQAFARRRCLVLADGFYEWQKSGRTRVPHFIRLGGSQPFAFAGLWESWEGDNDGPVESCTIITTEPNSLVAPIHDRMPVILSPDNHAQWLDPGTTNPKELSQLLVPYPAKEMEAFPVGNLVNNYRHDKPECVAPRDSGPSLFP